VQPTSTQAGSPIPDIQVTARDQFGNTATSFTGDVTIGIAVDPTGSAALAGITLRAASAGVATFSGLSITPAGDGFRLGASATGFSTVQSALFNITP
jgi:hypothetical protein